jgi:hypothetical protein
MLVTAFFAIHILPLPASLLQLGWARGRHPLALGFSLVQQTVLLHATRTVHCSGSRPVPRGSSSQARDRRGPSSPATWFTATTAMPASVPRPGGVSLYNIRNFS